VTHLQASTAAILLCVSTRREERTEDAAVPLLKSHDRGPLVLENGLIRVYPDIKLVSELASLQYGAGVTWKQCQVNGTPRCTIRTNHGGRSRSSRLSKSDPHGPLAPETRGGEPPRLTWSV
jgi:hypothetical protein